MIDRVELPEPSESSMLRVAYSCHEGLKILATNFHGQMLVAFGLVAAHCVEALLKCHLMQNGWNNLRLQKEIGHNLETAWRTAAACGPPVTGEPPGWVRALNAGHSRPYIYRYTPHQYGIGTPRAEEVIEPIAPLLEELRKKCGYII